MPDVEPNEANPPSISPAKFKPVIKWIETPNDAIFVIRWMCRAPFKTSLDVQPDINLNDEIFVIPHIDTSFEVGVESYICCVDDFVADGFFAQEFVLRKANVSEY